jgi:hypothetical protein
MAGSNGPAPSLIRTGLRDRLPRGLSYPVGAEQLSQALADVPQFGGLWIAFNKHVLGMGIDAPEPLKGFRRAFAADWHQGGWSLKVFAVHSKERSAVRELVMPIGLSAVRQWLRVARPETWFVGMRWLEVGYSLSSREVCRLESKDHRTITWSVASVTERRAKPAAPAVRPHE